MTRLLLRLAVNALAIMAAVRLLPGLHFDGGWVRLAGVALVFAAVNATLKPIVRFLTCPLVILTLGLFALVINGLMVLATAWVSEGFGLGFRVDDFRTAVLAGIVIGVVTVVLNLLIPDPREH